MVAQDVIVTKQSERIDATILEVSDQEVKYKKQSNPTGPTFTLSTAKIASIIYANGEVQTFSQIKESRKDFFSRGNADEWSLYPGLEFNLSAGCR